MDGDDKKSEDEAAEPAPDVAQEEGGKLHKVSEEKLKQILAAHEAWLETDGKEGEKAALFQTDLQGVRLFGANLRKASVPYANLQGAQLDGANLQEADFEEANLKGAYLIDANLQGADLQGANLRGANLTKAKNLTREQLDDAFGDEKTKLPDDLADYQMKAYPRKRDQGRW